MPTISLTVDLISAALLFVVIVASVIGALSTYMRRSSSHLQLWLAGIAALGVGMLLLLARGNVPDMLSILVANLLIIASYAAFAAGTFQLAGRSPGLPLVVGAAAAIVFTSGYLLGVSMETRIVIFCVLAIAESLMVAFGFLKTGRHLATYVNGEKFSRHRHLHDLQQVAEDSHKIFVSLATYQLIPVTRPARRVHL